ncbi:hypothetical protein [Bremerella alba]|uniref:Carboxypeptidase regulatory-like domain-containing protein n=1 Tax=Bremerella alba TaxID=980252 RepID=A0A7V8V9Y8_9BACT|nr:hypothetical protein [Bremerella alba]MBA2117663.1 hypothetical protein [Bremerella alba]
MKYALSFACLLLCSLGCYSSNNSELISIQGTVDFQGSPVKEGVVQFIPAQGVKAPARTAPVVDGNYELNGRFGLMPGTYNIKIEGYEGKDVPLSDPTQTVTPRRQILPPKYNQKTEIAPVIVTLDDRSLNQDFQLN